ncbi:hypothetical protein ENKO_07710 [Enterobacter kobei]|uniref:Uncharacterized protein n=1 Tax=Enterobacter kobei TaxID=208224 RepID=A0AA86M7I0_9ENTR|nr:hypothetical protein ENKO_07710 [Enterobacter kobei]
MSDILSGKGSYHYVLMITTFFSWFILTQYIGQARNKKYAVELVKEALCFDILLHRKLMKVQTFGFWWAMNTVSV